MNALDFFDKVKSNYKKFQTNETAFLEEKMKGFGDIAKTESENNDKRVSLIKASTILIFVSIYIIISTGIVILLVSIF
jgi:hypothetical protein